MRAIFKHLRLLPAVVIVGISVLAIKGVDIARAAQGAVEDLDAGLAPSDVNTPPHPDYANGEDPSDSASEVDVLTSLTHRREELDARERGLGMRESLLNASEGRVNQKIAALQALQTQIQGLLKQRDQAQLDQINNLIKSYSGMKPAQAAVIFNTMPDEVLLPIAKGMKPDVLGDVMAKMNPDAAQKLTVKLAAMLKLPETATAAACPVPPGSPMPGPTADAAPAPGGNPPVTLDTPPQQTAAATPPPPAPATTPPAAAPAPAKPQQTAAATPPAPAKLTTADVTPPKPHHAPPHHVAHAAPPPKPTSTNPPVTLDKPIPSQAAAATPPKPAAMTPAPTQAASAAPPKPAAAAPVPTQAAATPPKPSAATPAPTQAAAAAPPPAATTAPAASPASGSPTPLTH